MNTKADCHVVKYDEIQRHAKALALELTIRILTPVVIVWFMMLMIASSVVHAQTFTDKTEAISSVEGFNYVITNNDDGTFTIVTAGHVGNGALSKSLPDLVVYKGKASYNDYPEGSVYEVAFPDLRHSPLGAVLEVSVAEGTVEVVHDNTVEHDNGDMSWVGVSKYDGNNFRTILTSFDGGVMGSIKTPTNTYLIESDQGHTYLIDTNAAGLVQQEIDEGGAALPSAGATTTTSPIILPKPSTRSTKVTTSSSSSYIDTFYYIGTGFGVSPSGTDQSATRLNYLVTVGNQGLKDSGLSTQIRVVGTKHWEDTVVTNNNNQLVKLYSSVTERSARQQIINTYKADEIIYLRAFKYAQGSCGVHFINGANGTQPTPSGALGIVTDGKDGIYYCQDVTLIHEHGHGLGLVHDREYAYGSVGYKPWAYAWGIAGKYATIMSYKQPMVVKFASPSLKCTVAGDPCGYSQTDTARSSDQVSVLKLTIPMVAAFK
ncbi:MAG: zinc-dependent metalloprotease family protein [Candidatus Nitrosotenuis sp.]